MKAKVAVLFLAMTALAAALPARSQDSMTMTTPVFGQIVSYQLPAGFQPSYEEAGAEGYIQEAVPAGETVNDWSQMITMTGIKDAEGHSDMLEGAAQVLAGHFQQACAETFTGTSFGATEINGLAGLMVFLGCGTVAPSEEGREARSETAVIVYVKSAFGYVTVQWAERGPPVAARPEYDIDTWKPRLAQLLPIRLCDAVAGEEPPYLSCNAKP
ncbi:MAG: hypothetical protein LDL42_18175 [Rhizobium sp.]|nr:hypothetical protein [Rhizobium sp.]